MKLRNRVRWVVPVLALQLASLGGQAAERGYIGAEASWVYSHGACEEQARSCDNENAGGGFFVGYQINDWLALEVGYDDLGEITADYPARGQPDVTAHYKAEMHGIEFAAKPYWQVNENVSLFAKLGALAWNMEVTGNEVMFQHQASDDGWSPLFGAGVEFAFGGNWSALLEFQGFDEVGGSSTGYTDVTVVNLGVTYHFGSGSEADLASVPPSKPAMRTAPMWAFRKAYSSSPKHATHDLSTNSEVGRYQNLGIELSAPKSEVMPVEPIVVTP